MDQPPVESNQKVTAIRWLAVTLVCAVIVAVSHLLLILLGTPELFLIPLFASFACGHAASKTIGAAGVVLACVSGAAFLILIGGLIEQNPKDNSDGEATANLVVVLLNAAAAFFGSWVRRAK